MSVEASTFVWMTSKQKHSALLMLLALADYANHEGQCWPGIKTLADKTRMTQRNAQTLLQKLVASGDITIDISKGVKTKTGMTNRYTLVGFTDWLKGVKELSSLDGKGMKKSSPHKKQGVQNPSPVGVQEISSPGVQNPSPDPSYRTINIEPSISLQQPPNGVAADALADEFDETPVTSKALTAYLQKQATDHLSEPTQPITPETKRESAEPDQPTIVQEKALETPPPVPVGSPVQPLTICKPLPDAPAGYAWYMTAGDNYLLHLAKPTPSGKQIKPICGAPGNYATAVTDKTVVGNRQPCPNCQRQAAAKTALVTAGAKAPRMTGGNPARKAQPYDGLLDAVATQLFGATDRASINAVAGRVSKIIHGDKNGMQCCGLIAYECERQNRERNELDYNQLAADVERFARWRRQTYPDIKEIKDCVKVLDYWQRWRNAAAKDDNKWTYDRDTGKWKEPTCAK